MGYTMKGFFVVFVIAASAMAYAENFENDAVFNEVSSSIESMKKKGATEADCKDLAKTSCKEVEKERITDQKVINKLETGKKCLTLGQGGIRKAELHYKRTKKTHYSWKIKVKQALDYKVAFSSRTFSSLKRGQCGFIFGSSSYLKAKAKYSHYIRVEVAWRGRVTESWKVVLAMRKVAKRMVKKCQCATRAQYYKVWRTVTKTTRVARQNKAHAKCKMMACVLKGTPLTSKKCKGSLPPFKKKKLHSATAKVKCPAKRPTPKVAECQPATVKGQEFYTWTGRYCYHIIVGSVLEQGRWNGQRKSLCNKKGFKKSVTIGRGKGVSKEYHNGSSRACPGGKKRSASLKIMSGGKYAMKVSEPRTCHYAMVMTIPHCRKMITRRL